MQTIKFIIFDACMNIHYLFFSSFVIFPELSSKFVKIAVARENQKERKKIEKIHEK